MRATIHRVANSDHLVLCAEALAPGETNFKAPRDDASDTVLRRNSVLSSKVLQANFRNQAKVYEAEQQHIEDAKKREIAKVVVDYVFITDTAPSPREKFEMDWSCRQSFKLSRIISKLSLI